MPIKRRLSSSLIKSLKEEQLYQKKLFPEILLNLVFPAIRNNSIDFYHKGGLLFRYDNAGFKTHIKYASIIPNQGKDYLNEQELQSYKLATDFLSNYDRIKENCANYSGVEALGVSQLYHSNPPYLANTDIVVLDIEIALLSLSDDRTTDRIDILLYDTKKRVLQFVEAKHFSNKDLFSTTTPKAVRQVRRYENQIKENKAEIIAAYTDFIDDANALFGTNQTVPLDVGDNVILLIFGFDEDQKAGRLQSLILGTKSHRGNYYNHYKDLKLYSKGDLNNANLKAIWNSKII